MKLLLYAIGIVALMGCIATAQNKDTLYTIEGYKFQDKWTWRTVLFPKSSDTMRLIIDKDTIYTVENYFRVLVRHELKKMGKQ
jgi:hypothetical protein